MSIMATLEPLGITDQVKATVTYGHSLSGPGTPA